MIYSEVVYLNQDNKVIIEVLDGRTAKLIFEATPVTEEIVGRNKVQAIYVSGKPYLKLGEYDKIYMTMDGKPQVYNITFIQKLEDKVFLAHTQRRTKTSYFALPSLGGVKDVFRWSQYFVNSFLSTDHKSLFVLYRFFSTDNYREFEYYLTMTPYYRGMHEYDHQHTMFQFAIPDKWLPDIELFAEGKYSKMSDEYKTQILAFHGFQPEGEIGQILYKSKIRQQQLALDLGVSAISDDLEVYDRPNLTEEIYQKEQITV